MSMLVCVSVCSRVCLYSFVVCSFDSFFIRFRLYSFVCSSIICLFYFIFDCIPLFVCLFVRFFFFLSSACLLAMLFVCIQSCCLFARLLSHCFATGLAVLQLCCCACCHTALLASELAATLCLADLVMVLPP